MGILYGALLISLYYGSIPLWALFPIAIALIALLESKRNKARVDAMLKLKELDSNVNPPNSQNQQYN